MLLTFLLSPSVGADSNGYVYDGNSLVAKMKVYEKTVGRGAPEICSGFEFHGYVLGVFDATCYMYNAPDKIPSLQICAIVAKYLKDHPERWNQTASYLVMSAFGEAFGLDAEYIKKGCK